ncbi:MAG: dihydropteroate synthase [Clostridiales bacterium]|nr:dihydropteroate synthase [Clostridiales bacterium]
MIVGGREFKDYTYVMAIINLTPDSFYSGSRRTEDDVLFAVERAIKDGAAIIDLGAQSTRPGYIEVPAEEEIRRFEKPLRMIKERFDIPVSVDTYFATAARAALMLGADMINDVWGLAHDADMAKIVAEYDGAVCIMHNSKEQLQGEIFCPILNFLENALQKAIDAGIDKDKICIDGGIGFAKDVKQNHELLNGYEKLNKLGYPTLLGCSRKSMFGGRAEDRLQATLDATRSAVNKGVMFVRVHDVKENFETIKQAYESLKRV